MDETEYEIYLRAIFNLGEKEARELVEEQTRDEDGFRVPGCYRTVPTPTE